jgi:hypothetical protein
MSSIDYGASGLKQGADLLDREPMLPRETLENSLSLAGPSFMIEAAVGYG